MRVVTSPLTLALPPRERHEPAHPAWPRRSPVAMRAATQTHYLARTRGRG
jgi:hypothetical protein